MVAGEKEYLLITIELFSDPKGSNMNQRLIYFSAKSYQTVKFYFEFL